MPSSTSGNGGCETSFKSSVFHDRHIRERGDSLPEFDKAILRHQRERMFCVKEREDEKL
jgi:nucleolar protein 14